jgi:hypothetical protein
MKNVIGAVVLAACAALPFGILAQTSGGGGVPLPCWEPTWQQHTCLGTCAGAWCKCPGRVRCAPVEAGGRTLGAYVNVAVTCEDWTGIAGTCSPTSLCTGGTKNVVQAGTCIVTVSTQTCPGTCP